MSVVIDIGEVLRDLLARAPEWIRTDLASKDAITRSRAEETLAAMIEAALNKDRTAAPTGNAVVDDAGDRT